MISIGCNYSKLKTNLRLAICRLKLLEKKKIELAQKSRKEISEYLANDKIDLAKIRVEHVIREDLLIEAMGIVEMYCDQLLSRFGLIQQKTHSIDEALQEAISSLLWVAPRLQADVAELKTISNQLAVKYGKRYALAARENSSCFVNEKLIHQLSAQALSKTLAEKYLIEIARSYDVVYEPDEKILAEEKKDGAICNVSFIDLDDTKPPGPGFFSNLPSSENDLHPDIQNPPADLPKSFNYPAPNMSSKTAEVLPAFPPSELYPEPGTNLDTIDFKSDALTSYNESVFGVSPSASNVFENNTLNVSNTASVTSISKTKSLIDVLPELLSVPYPEPGTNPNITDFNTDASTLHYENVFEVNPSSSNVFANNTSSILNTASVTASQKKKSIIDVLPELPSVPNTILSDFGETGIGNTEVDFDDLVKRFKALKER